MQNKHTPIEYVVEEYVSKFGELTVQCACGNNKTVSITEEIPNWLRTTLQSQADQYEREKGEMVSELFKVLEYQNTERELNAEQHERMGIRLALQQFKLKFAQKYGVDLSE
jgi:hypothetical protein